MAVPAPMTEPLPIPRPKRTRPLLLLAGLVMLAGPFLDSNPWFGGRVLDWPWAGWGSLGTAGPQVNFIAWVAAGVLAVVHGSGFGGARTRLALWVAGAFALIRFYSVALDAPGEVRERFRMVWTLAPGLLGAGAIVMARRGGEASRAARAALFAGCFGLLAAYATWFRQGDSVVVDWLRRVPYIWRGIGLGREHSPVARSQMVQDLWSAIVPVLLEALAVGAAVAAAFLSRRPGAERAARRSAVAALFLQATFWLVPVVAMLVAGWPGPDGDGARWLADVTSKSIVGGAFGLWLLATALGALALADPRPTEAIPPRSAPASAPRWPLVLGAALLLAGVHYEFRSWNEGREVREFFDPRTSAWWGMLLTRLTLFAAALGACGYALLRPGSRPAAVVLLIAGMTAWLVLVPSSAAAMGLLAFGAEVWVPAFLAAVVAAWAAAPTTGGDGWRLSALLAGWLLLLLIVCPIGPQPDGPPWWLTGDLPSLLWNTATGHLGPVGGLSGWVPPLLATALVAGIGLGLSGDAPSRRVRLLALVGFAFVVAYRPLFVLGQRVIHGPFEDPAKRDPGAFAVATELLGATAFAWLAYGALCAARAGASGAPARGPQALAPDRRARR